MSVPRLVTRFPMQSLVLVSVMSRMAMAIQDLRVPGESKPGYYYCPQPGCQEIRELIVATHCPVHRDVLMEWLADDLPDE